MDEPVPSKVPPQLLVYHFQLAPVPSLPPLTDRLLVLPKHTDEVGPEIELAATEVSLTVMVVEIQPDAPQLSSARTQYVVVCEGDTLIVLPLATNPTAQLVLYHFQEPPDPRVPPFFVRFTVSP